MSIPSGVPVPRPESVKKYRTIVADPPWRYKTALPGFPGERENSSSVPYSTLTVSEIQALPVLEWVDSDAHLYLWTTNTHLEHAWSVSRAWGFEPSTTLVWCKTPRGITVGTYSICTEFVLFCRRGSLKAEQRLDRNWFEWRRTQHSAKPEAFLDLVEQVSPEPRLEMFARRARFGWDYWGDQSLQTAEVAA